MSCYGEGDEESVDLGGAGDMMQRLKRTYRLKYYDHIKSNVLTLPYKKDIIF